MAQRICLTAHHPPAADPAGAVGDTFLKFPGLLVTLPSLLMIAAVTTVAERVGGPPRDLPMEVHQTDLLEARALCGLKPREAHHSHLLL